MTELVRRLIDLQKAQSSEGSVIDAKRISALAVARAAINDNQVQADARYIDIRLNVNGKPVPISAGEGDDEPSETELMIMADADAMQTAVKNLVENAIHYSPEHTTVAVGVGERDGKVTIRVVDQGIGIPEKSLDRVFERFYRVDPARSRETGGSGLCSIGIVVVRDGEIVDKFYSLIKPRNLNIITTGAVRCTAFALPILKMRQYFLRCGNG